MPNSPLHLSIPPDELASVLGRLLARSREQGGCRVFSSKSIELASGRGLEVARAAWIVRNGPLPPNRYVRAACGNRRCLRHVELIPCWRAYMRGVWEAQAA